MTPGSIALISFPYTDNHQAKLRPVLLLAKSPGPYKDWVVCMISSQLHQEIKGIDEVIRSKAGDFATSGLKNTSLVRATRLAIVEESLLLGSIGEISSQRLKKIKANIAEWIKK